MNLVKRNGSQVVIRQIPITLFVVAVFLSLPFLVFSLFHLIGGTDANGKFFCLFFGLFILWLFLEFVATRERIGIDLLARVLTRRVNGVFIHKTQVIDLNDVERIRVELRTVTNGIKRRPRQYLYMYGSKEKFLLNSPAKVYIDHAKLGKLLSEVTLIPYEGQTVGN
jgi:hypothetical protein